MEGPVKPDLSRHGLSTARRWADCIDTMGGVTQPTLQNPGTGIVISENTHHWTNLGFLVQILIAWDVYTRGIRDRASGVCGLFRTHDHGEMLRSVGLATNSVTIQVQVI